MTLRRNPGLFLILLRWHPDMCWFQLWSCIWEKGEDIDLGVSLQSRVADVAGWMFANFLKTPQDSVNTDVFKSCITHKLLMMNSLVVMHLWNKLKRGFLHYTNVHLKPLSANPRLYKHICEHAFAVMDTSAAQTYCMIILGSVNLCGSAKGEHGRRDKNCSLSLRQSVSKHWTSVQRQKKGDYDRNKKKGKQQFWHSCVDNFPGADLAKQATSVELSHWAV